jgi:hypothetical protein
MQSHSGKSPETPNKAVANNFIKKDVSHEPAVEFTDNRKETAAQRKLQELANNNLPAHPLQKKENKTGLPDQLKSGIENISGFSMDDVKVHYNSPQPSQLQAFAFAQGNQIHIGPGQEKHLPHETWHVVQQKQGRVKPTMTLGKVSVNDSSSLENEATVMGAKAMHPVSQFPGALQQKTIASAVAPVQRAVGFEFETPWTITKPADVDWNTDSKLVTGTNWYMSPDELDEDEGKIEFKTSPIEVDGDAAALQGSINTLFDNLRAYTDVLAAVAAADTALPQANATFNGVTVTPNGALAARPQVTGGVRIDLILRFLQDMTDEAAADGTDLMPGAVHKERLTQSIAATNVDPDSQASMSYAGTVALLSFYVRTSWSVFDGVKAEVDALKATFVPRVQAVNDNAGLSDAQKDVAKQALKTERDAGIQAIIDLRKPKYAKMLAATLPRLRFRKLPGITTATLLRDVLAAAGLAHDAEGTQLYPLGLKVDDSGEIENETIKTWIDGIQAEDPTEALTDDHEFWGEREIESADVGAGNKRGAAILFELRGFAGGQGHAGWKAFATLYTTYFRKLNKKAKAPNA